MMVNERIAAGDSMAQAIDRVELLMLPPEEAQAKQNLAAVQSLGLQIVGMPTTEEAA